MSVEFSNEKNYPYAVTCKHEMTCVGCGQDMSDGFEGHYSVLCHKPGCFQSPSELAEKIANALGAAEMLSSTVVSVIPTILAVLKGEHADLW